MLRKTFSFPVFHADRVQVLHAVRLLLWFALPCHTSIAQQPFQFSFHRLSPNEGLSQGSNAFVYQDSKGFVWLSSTDGLNRFDGKSVKIYKANAQNGMLDNIVAGNFFEDAASNLWFATYEGIHCYWREKDRFERFQLKDAKGQAITHDYYTFHLDAKGQLWVRTGLGQAGYLHLFNIFTHRDSLLCPLDGQRNYPILNAQGAVTQVVSANFYNKPGIEVLDVQHQCATTHYLADPVRSGLAPAKTYALYQQRDTLWWLAMTNGLAAFNPLRQKGLCYDVFEGRSIGEVWAVAPLQDSMLLVSSSKEGLLLFHQRRRQFVQNIPPDTDSKFGLSVQSIAAFYVDQQENLWLSSPRGGVNFTNLHKQKFEKKAPLQGVAITAVFQAKDGFVWCNGKAGEVFRYHPDGTRAELFKLEGTGAEVPAGKAEYFFEDPNGTLWLCYQRYLFKWNPVKQAFQYAGVLPNFILYVGKRSDGQALLTTYSGIFTFKNTEKGLDFVKADFLGRFQAELATAVYEDQQKRLYLALDATRMVILAPKNGQYEEMAATENIGYARAFYETPEALWVATTTGILKVNTHDLSWIKLNETEHGAPSENYYSILPDRQGRFWLSCNRGIVCYDATRKTCRRYTLADGLQDNEFNRNAFLLLPDGTIWMGGNQGMNVFHPDRMQDVPYRPNVQLTNLLVNDEPFETATQIGELRRLTLPYQQNTLALEFVALEYSDPTLNQFRYQLVNYDKDWVDAGTHGFARYANLPPGHYIFKVKAANSDGVWNETPQELYIQVLTPWWRSWWFYLLCITTLAALVYGFFTYRLRQALKIERMRVKISSDLHDDVGTILSGLAMQSEILELSATEAMKPRLKRIGELSRSAMSHLRDTVWAIDARKDKLENLLDRMREHAEENLTPKGIVFDLETEQFDLQKNMPANIRQNLYLIYKEAITNIAKHSDADRVRIKLQKWGQTGLEMQIADNGNAVEKAYKTTGSGTSNMQMRAEKIGGTLEIIRENGFCVRLRVKRV